MTPATHGATLCHLTEDGGGEAERGKKRRRKERGRRSKERREGERDEGTVG